MLPFSLAFGSTGIFLSLKNNSLCGINDLFLYVCVQLSSLTHHLHKPETRGTSHQVLGPSKFLIDVLARLRNGKLEKFGALEMEASRFSSEIFVFQSHIQYFYIFAIILEPITSEIKILTQKNKCTWDVWWNIWVSWNTMLNIAFFHIQTILSIESNCNLENKLVFGCLSPLL